MRRKLEVTLYVGLGIVTCPIGYSLSGDGLSIGRDTLSAVRRDYMEAISPSGEE
jgi:hypothetical protein